jgi:hypothetical protein
VRMLVPPVIRRREMDRRLVEFFHQQRPGVFRQAISDFCRYYAIKPPRIQWCEYIDWGKAAGKTFEDGRIHLVHPENWQRGRIYNSERMWVQTVYHELGHYLFWTDAERKAEVFTQLMVRGLRRTPKPRVVVSRRRAAPAQRPAIARRRRRAVQAVARSRPRRSNRAAAR